MPAVNIPIWPTLEYAINDFKSVWRIQIKLVSAPPHKARLVIWGANLILKFINSQDIRRSPYLPNFNKMPAKIIDPATGASTWALGSHKCTRNRGIFTIKAIIVINHQNFIVFEGSSISNIWENINKDLFEE